MSLELGYGYGGLTCRSAGSSVWRRPDLSPAISLVCYVCRIRPAVEGFALKVRALRDIEAGESVSISYAPLEECTKDRRTA